MSNALTVIACTYENRQVRTFLDDEGNIFFALTDLCRVLDISNSRNVASRLDDDEKGVRLMDTLRGQQRITVVTEAGMYNVVLRSDKPQAKAFRRWITHEVLPSIRKHGHYQSQPTQAALSAKPKDWALIIANGTDDNGQTFHREPLYATPDNLGYTSLRSKGGRHCHTVSFDGPGKIDTFDIATAIPERIITQSMPFAFLPTNGVNQREQHMLHLLNKITTSALVTPWRNA